jgi:cytochrome c peroxidase
LLAKSKKLAALEVLSISLGEPANSTLSTFRERVGQRHERHVRVERDRRVEGYQGTNNTTVSVNTDGQFQVPRLRELDYRAPYLHDGRAHTLEERFTAVGGGDQHGVTSGLSPAQLADLIVYLRSR